MTTPDPILADATLSHHFGSTYACRQESATEAPAPATLDEAQVAAHRDHTTPHQPVPDNRAPIRPKPHSEGAGEQPTGDCRSANGTAVVEQFDHADPNEQAGPAGLGPHDGPWLVLLDGDIADVAGCMYEARLMARHLADVNESVGQWKVIEVVPAASHLS
ncbi:hypothetical protein [Nocardioides sp. WS12]|uniref:hypothetical protein n=1 Tax=Nocardioides sp. WS12 TaxID=2486272 RepID=UPI0015F9BA42|nr:hypothetical protein [Nocardioides sp. WS12]